MLCRACIALATTLLATGCSTGVDNGESVRAGAAVTTLIKLCARDKPSDIADLLTTPARDTFMNGSDARDGCARILGVHDFTGVRVTHVHAVGGDADVEIQAPDGTTSTVEAEEQGEDWRVTRTRLPA